MNFVTFQKGMAGRFARRYTTFEVYRASALNLFHRGVDGLSLFNYDYVPAEKRLAMAEGLKGITDVEYLKTMPRNPAYATRDALKFYAVPLDILVPGSNRVEIKNLDKQKTTCKLLSMELAIYKRGVRTLTK